ncbi:unnamed protein product [Linum tenue]|uniref:Uncharacterized protein n=1 Tax=Linum tenue TaxID=586396 RepID=A0AAV0N2L5_9ROSI|nr:unnamed protein product [Linum tenue]
MNVLLICHPRKKHRYYGESVPFGSWEKASRNATSLGYLNSAQVLASWFRLKYPHVAIGALASSAPILYFDGVAPGDGYYSVVTKDFKVTSNRSNTKSVIISVSHAHFRYICNVTS